MKHRWGAWYGGLVWQRSGRQSEVLPALPCKQAKPTNSPLVSVGMANVTLVWTTHWLHWAPFKVNCSSYWSKPTTILKLTQSLWHCQKRQNLFLRSIDFPRLSSDDRTSFTSQEFKVLTTHTGFRHVRSSAYHPFSNGLTELQYKLSMKRYWRPAGTISSEHATMKRNSTLQTWW